MKELRAYQLANTVLACASFALGMNMEGWAHDALLFAAGLMFGFLITEILHEGDTE
jgi:hypothetical protein